MSSKIPILASVLVLSAACAWGQQPVASVSTTGVNLRGSMSVANGRAVIANNGEITAGASTAQVALARGGSLAVCRSTSVHIGRDSQPSATPDPNDTALMFSLDHGAFEAHYTSGAYSDVILTPDLRLFVSPPGKTNLSLRVSAQGDTCVDNAGQDAPYVIVSSLMDGGAYRVRPGQRVLFVHGSLNQVVDNEHDPCGCPPDEPATPGSNDFPTAVSEGLEAPPKLSGPPVVPPGQVHAEVSATLSSNTPPPGPPPASTPRAAPTTPPAAAPIGKAPSPHRGFFHSIGHFFSKVFGAD